MNAGNIGIAIVISLLSGLLGVIISSFYYQRFEHRRAKREVLRRLVGNRIFLTPPLVTEKSEDFFIALNEIFVVFSPSVFFMPLSG